MNAAWCPSLVLLVAVVAAVACVADDPPDDGGGVADLPNQGVAFLA